MTETDRTLLKLLRLALGTDDGTPLYDITELEWRRLIDASYDQGLPSVVLDGLHLAQNKDPQRELTIESPEMEDDKYDWLGGVFQDEEDNRKFSMKLGKLCSMFSANGLRPVLLKGLGLGFDYPVPEHRPVGDIDLFLLEEDGAGGAGAGAGAGAATANPAVPRHPGPSLRHPGPSLRHPGPSLRHPGPDPGSVPAARRGDLLMRQVLGIDVTKTRFGRHSHASYRGIPIENHYALGAPDSGRKKAIRLDERMRDLISRDLRPATATRHPGPDPGSAPAAAVGATRHPVPGATDPRHPGLDSVPGATDPRHPGPDPGSPLYYLPSADFNAVFLMWHLGSHLCYEKLLLRQLCDYMMFLRAHRAEIHWDLVREIWRDADLERFAVIINSILIKYLGMPAEYVPDWARHSAAPAAGTPASATPAAAGPAAVSTSPRHSGPDPESEMIDRVMAEILTCPTRSFKFVSNVAHYFTDAWKYKLVGGQHWLRRLAGSTWQHIACRADRKELPVR